ncbi:hypothetical protein QEN19_000783 [Hanseniaspora menglaensis]
MSHSVNSSSYRKRENQKNTIKYNILLLGADNLGKSTFANNLLNKIIFTNDSFKQYKKITFDNAENHDYENQETDESVKVLKPVRVALYTDGHNFVDQKSTDSSLSNVYKPSIEDDALFHLKSVDLSIASAEEELHLTMLKSECFGTSIDNEKSILELQTFMEDLFDQVLAEETRIKRNPRFEDGRIHVTLYFLEPNGHGLKELDLKAIKLISKYTNVLPVIARSDSFNEIELKLFKQKVMDDFEHHHIPVFKFSVSNDMLDGQLEDDLESIKDNKYLDSIQPFSIVTSDEIDSNGEYCRRYNWLGDGISVPINSMEFNELSILKRVLFGSHLQDFKDTMTNFLYETYRSNKLQSSFEQNSNTKINKKLSESPSFVDLKKGQSGAAINASSSIPSLSNYQQLVINGQPSTYSLSRLAQQRKNDDDASSDSESVNHHSLDSYSNSVMRDKLNLRNISQTVPYQLTRDRLMHQKQKLEKIETDSAKELQKKIEELERKAMELKKKEKLMKLQKLQHSQNESISLETESENFEESTVFKGDEEHLNNNDEESFNDSVIKNDL